MKRAHVAFVLGCILAACKPSAEAANDAQRTYAVYTELALTNKPMHGESNKRMMNRMNPGTQSFVSYDSASGLFAFAPGTYRINAYSITAYGYLMKKASQDSVHSAPGYAYLCNVDSNAIVILGSMQDPMFALPSEVQDVIAVTVPTRFYLGHQNGDSVLVRGVKLQTADTTATTSINHAMANIVIEKLPDVPRVPSKSLGPCGPPSKT